MDKKYYTSIDYAKLVCAILVVCIHTGPLISLNEPLNFFVVQIVARIAVPFFFLTSAFFFFRSLNYEESLTSPRNIARLKTYAKRILTMYIFWSVIYLTIQIPMWIYNGFTVHTLLVYVRDFFFQGSYYHLWFLPGLLCSTVLVYFMISKSKADRIFYVCLTLYFIGMLINVYADFFQQIPLISTLLNAYLGVFATARNAVFFGCIFVFIGYYFAINEAKLNRNVKRYIIYFVLSFLALVAEVYIITYLGYMNDLTCMYFMLIPTIITLFSALLSIKFNMKSNPSLRRSGTLIYFSHCYFSFLWGLIPLVRDASLLYFTIVLVSSLACVALYDKVVVKIPFLRRVI